MIFAFYDLQFWQDYYVFHGRKILETQRTRGGYISVIWLTLQCLMIREEMGEHFSKMRNLRYTENDLQGTVPAL